MYGEARMGAMLDAANHALEVVQARELKKVIDAVKQYQAEYFKKLKELQQRTTGE